jgi:hypothetical protein
LNWGIAWSRGRRVPKAESRGVELAPAAAAWLRVLKRHTVDRDVAEVLSANVERAEQLQARGVVVVILGAHVVCRQPPKTVGI